MSVNNKNNNDEKGDEDMSVVHDRVKSPIERFKDSYNEYRTTKDSQGKLMTFSEMMKRLEEDDH